MKETTAYYMNVLLRNVVTSGTGSTAYLDNMPAAGKTGTTDKNNDRWFIGYTPYYVAAVWTGYDTPEAMNISGNPAIPLWKSVMSQIHSGLEYKNFFTTTTGPEILNNLTDATMTDKEKEAKEEEERLRKEEEERLRQEEEERRRQEEEEANQGSETDPDDPDLPVDVDPETGEGGNLVIPIG